MTTPRLLLRAVVFGVIAEAAATAISIGLFSLHHGREPMEPPFNWTATMLQMPGILVSDAMARTTAIHAGWFQFSVIYCVQALIWSIIGLAFFGWRARRNK
jgi:hypothetical protein